MMGVSGIDWGTSDSLITEIDNLVPNSQMDVPKPHYGAKAFTKVVRKGLSSTPQRKSQSKYLKTRHSS